MNEVAVDLRAIARGADVMEDILPMIKNLRSMCKFPEEGMTKIVLITSKFDAEREGSQQDSGGKVTTAKGVDSPTEAQHLLCITRKLVICQDMSVRWSDDAKLA